jgi:hypothetical protein
MTEKTISSDKEPSTIVKCKISKVGYMTAADYLDTCTKEK